MDRTLVALFLELTILTHTLKGKYCSALEPLRFLFTLPGTLSSQPPTLLTPSLFCSVIFFSPLLEYELHEGKDLRLFCSLLYP